MITLAIILLIVLIFTWIYSMFISWKSDEGVRGTLVEIKPFVTRWQQSMRLTRRGWYSTAIFSKQVFKWSNEKIMTLFIKMFPKSASVFVKRDMMTGLTQGPSSYFLKIISSPRKAGNRRLPHTKKVL